MSILPYRPNKFVQCCTFFWQMHVYNIVHIYLVVNFTFSFPFFLSEIRRELY